MKCEFCGSNNVIKKGNRYNQRGKVQRYGCKDCKAGFTKGNIAYHMQYRRFFIGYTLKLRKEGHTLTQIANELGNIVSRQTILKWIKKFGKFENIEKEVVVNMKNQYKPYKRIFKIKV